MRAAEEAEEGGRGASTSAEAEPEGDGEEEEEPWRRRSRGQHQCRGSAGSEASGAGLTSGQRALYSCDGGASSMEVRAARPRRCHCLFPSPRRFALQVTVIALHHDDPEGMYATIRLPDGRERHTEASRLLPPPAAAGARAESAGW